MKEYKIDASGKKLGRVASEVASILLGKNNPDFQKNKRQNFHSVEEFLFCFFDIFIFFQPNNPRIFFKPSHLAFGIMNDVKI